MLRQNKNVAAKQKKSRQSKKATAKLKKTRQNKKTVAKQKRHGKTKKLRQNKNLASKKARANTVWSFIHEYFTIFITSVPLCKKNYITAFNYREHEQVVI